MRLPDFYIEKMKGILGADFDNYIKSFNEEPQSGIRVNTLKINADELEKISGFKLEKVKWCAEGFYCAEGKPAKSWLYHAGLYYIQEPSAMSAAEVLPIKNDYKVLDMCAAPGGKTTQLAARLNGSGIIFSNDISATRAKAIVKNIELFGVKNCVVLSETPEKIAERFTGYFDAVLVDAPCGGEGMFRKNPDLIKSYNKELIDFCANAQREILNSAAYTVKKGGYIVYSTCTFSPQEDEQVIDEFLNCHDDFELCPINESFGFSKGIPMWASGREELSNCGRIWPNIQRGEGHFIALLRKKGADEKKDFRYFEYKTDKTSQENIKAAEEFFAGNLKNTPQGRFWSGGENVYILPDNMPDISGLRILRSGLFCGNVKKGRFEPSQALAMSLKAGDVKNEADFEPNDERVIRYLKGESVVFENCGDGWTLVLAGGFPLGWAKAQKGRLKNKYSVSWRWE